MAMTEKFITLVCLLAGFLWLRRRSRSVDLENQMLRALLGVFVVLPAALVGEKYLFEQFHFGTYTDILVRVLAILVTFPAIGYGFLKSGAAGEHASASPTPVKEEA
jgi:hypothetical protein